jgi:hypothetical protein
MMQEILRQIGVQSEVASLAAPIRSHHVRYIPAIATELMRHSELSRSATSGH